MAQPPAEVAHGGMLQQIQQATSRRNRPKFRLRGDFRPSWFQRDIIFLRAYIFRLGRHPLGPEGVLNPTYPCPPLAWEREV
jgi:hypothetical protein